MKKNISIRINNNGFNLLEITVVLIIMSILISAVIPVFSRSYLEKAANKTALDMSTIEEASRKYYIDNNKWPDTSVYPTPLAALQAGGYLPPSSAWNAINPFGVSAAAPANYSYNILPPSALLLTVCTLVPSDALPIVENSLPSASHDANGNACSSVSVPGASSVIPTGLILPWPSGSLPAGGGFLLCDGTIYNVSAYPALASLLGSTYGGDGINTFGVPNLQGKTIFGYLSGDSNFGALGNTGGSTTLVGNGQWSSGHADTFNWYNQVKISGGSLWGMSGAQSAQGVSTAVLNPYITLNFVIKT